MFVESLDNVDIKLADWEENNSFPASKSEIAAGLEQGVNDLLSMIQDLPEPDRSNAYSVYYLAISKVQPDYFQKMDKKIDKISARGHIKNEREFYLIRARLDLAEGEGTDLERVLIGLLDQYESDA